jgi:MFS transporter, DHA2 family, multidrug resistance protein
MMADTNEWRPKANPWLITGAVMAATIMEVLDTSVANVALNHIAGNLSASTDDATWVLTSYLVSNAIIQPATGWFGQYFGRRNFLIGCICIFTLASAWCGMANSLGMLILARIVQGAGGGALQPISQAVLLETFPPEKRGSAMSIYIMGVVVAPILGPTLGGWMTDNMSWRWVFCINVPVGILSVALCFLFLEDPPYLKDKKAGRIDYIGFGLVTLWIGCLQIMLDKGQDADWFSSTFIRVLATGTALGFIAFIVWELKSPNPIVNLRVLANRNLATGAVVILVAGAIMNGTTVILPQFLQNLMNYTALQAGLVISPRGLGAIAGTLLAGRIMSKLDGRAFIAQGALLLALSMYWLGAINLSIAPSNLLWPIILGGFAVAAIFVAITTFSVATVPRQQMGDATGLTSLLRNLGGSIGISMLTNLVTRGTQAHQALMVGHLTPYATPFRNQVAALQHYLAVQGAGPAAAQHQAYGLIYQKLQQQASLWAYVDQFRLLALACAVLVPLVFLFQKGSQPLPEGAAMGH